MKADIYKRKMFCTRLGADESFFSRITPHNGNIFISTGKEQRDFDILIKAFKATGAPLKIITCKNHAGSNFEDLPKQCKNIPNIEVIITENSSDIYPQIVMLWLTQKR